MRFRCVVAIVCFWFANPCFVSAQRAASAGRESAQQVSGKVVSARDGRPLAGADVTLRESRSNRTVATIKAAADGSFGFDAVPAGRYQLRADAVGYLGASFLEHEGYFAAVVTGAGLRTDALVLRLMPACSISGRITDQAGEPVEQGRVSLYREQATEADGPVRRIRSVMADDDGSFDFDRLEPGRYFVSASASPWYAVHAFPEPENARFPYRSSVDPALDVVYPVTFYPAADSSDGASPIDLTDGTDFVADIQMTPVHGVMLTLQSRPGEAVGGRGVMLMSKVFGSEDPMPAQASFTNGVQTLVGIPPGRYEVREFGEGMQGAVRSQDVDLTSGSASLPAIESVTPADVKITLQAMPGSTVPEHLQVLLKRSGDGPLGANTLQNSAKGHAEFGNLGPGEYRIQLRDGAGSLNVIGVSVDGHASPDGRLHVGRGGEISATVTVGGKPVEVKGTAVRDGQVIAGAMVVLVPAGANVEEDAFRRDESDLDGEFRFENVGPGKYIVVAIEDGWELRWRDPATLMRYLLHGEAVAVPANGAGEVALREAVTAQAR